MKNKKKHTALLGERVLPLVKRSQYGAANCDTVGLLPYKKGDERIRYAKSVVDERCKEQRKENKEQEWLVWAVKADGTFDLLSDMGYEQCNVSRNEFRLIKK
jgi:hypothetical protein